MNIKVIKAPKLSWLTEGDIYSIKKLWDCVHFEDVNTGGCTYLKNSDMEKLVFEEVAQEIRK